MMNDILAELDKIEKKMGSDSYRVIGFRFYQIYYCLIYYHPVETLRHISDKTTYNVLIEKIPEIYHQFFQHPNDILSKKNISLGLMALFSNHSSANLDEYLARQCFCNLIKVLKYTPIIEEKSQKKNKEIIQTEDRALEEESKTIGNKIG
jgi:hypothetical protein